MKRFLGKHFNEIFEDPVQINGLQWILFKRRNLGKGQAEVFTAVDTKRRRENEKKKLTI